MTNQYFHKLISLTILLALSACTTMEFAEQIQITHDLTYNHDLDNNDNFSPDDQWLVYDTRTEEGGIGACSRIEKVNIATGEKIVLYELKQNESYGPGVGAVSYSHAENRIAFIHGLMNITADDPYQQWRRSGVMVEDANPGIPIFMDSRDVTFPFTPGALRGGTHRHEWSRDGRWIGFTYNDAILKHLEDSTGVVHNLRTIGVSKNITPTPVDQDADGENINGKWFSVLVVKVVANPNPGSDEISRAAGDSWVGDSGYLGDDGKFQRARGFIGTVSDNQENQVDEVFIVDIPEDITVPGADGPLEGTRTTMPDPPMGASQRRLTFTANTKYSGCQGIVRSSSDGAHLAFLAYDSQGIKQVFTITPLGGESVQQTYHDTDVQGGVRWHPSIDRFCYIWENSIVSKDIDASAYSVLTNSCGEPPSNLVWSHDGKIIAYNRLVTDDAGNQTKQIFIIKL